IKVKSIRTEITFVHIKVKSIRTEITFVHIKVKSIRTKVIFVPVKVKFATIKIIPEGGSGLESDGSILGQGNILSITPLCFTFYREH
ncbi:MAG: hypothetical protein WCJ01_11305, partial [Ignavibacteria bacterium]